MRMLHVPGLIGEDFHDEASCSLIALLSGSVNRKVMKEFTLSDGTILPVGTYLSVPLWETQTDEVRYAVLLNLFFTYCYFC